MADKLDNMGINERLLEAVAKLEVQTENLTKVVGDLTQSVRIVSEDLAGLKVTVEQIRSTETHTQYECERLFNEIYVRNDNFESKHRDAHLKMEKAIIQKQEIGINWYKIASIIMGICFAIALIALITGV